MHLKRVQLNLLTIPYIFLLYCLSTYTFCPVIDETYLHSTSLDQETGQPVYVVYWRFAMQMSRMFFFLLPVAIRAFRLFV